MFYKLIKKILPFTVILGTIAVTGIILFGTDSIHIVKNTSITYGSYTWNYYYLDVNAYLKNLEDALYNQQFYTGLPLPPQAPQFIFTDVLTSLKTIINILLMIINWLAYIINCIVLVPIKLILWPLRIFYVILGINTQDYDYVQITHFIYNINIPQIQYWA